MAEQDSPQPEATLAREMRIERIADMMRACEWRRGESGKALAKELGLAYQTIRVDAAEASKRVYAEMMADREAVGAQVGTALTKALQGAVEGRDWKSVASLAKVYADASGVSAPQKFEGALGVTTPTEAAKLVREAFGAQAAPSGDGES